MSGTFPFKNSRIIAILEGQTDTIEGITNDDGSYLICNFKKGTYHLWAIDSSDFSPKLVLNEKGDYVYSHGGYDIPQFIQKMFTKINIVKNDTVNTGTIGLFYPDNMRGKASDQ